ncbi:Hypothetical protein, putative [Bodo saltans]|uniref:Uncharacterized protein n=1 Tax=Bodo saltans TaxID=75058 RepID=A0A0S4IM25_BODSA|nr:Hypothetical protein, putative [Bodo saltans]|eukprot:CUE62711.1 Hypothetical protein, putative [Bodo saltans]
MSDWEQRLRLYSATASASRQRSVSPSAGNSTTGTGGGGIELVIPRGHVTAVDSDSLAYHRAKSPNALERLRASTAMNLVALELRGAGDSQTKLPTRTASPAAITVPRSNLHVPANAPMSTAPTHPQYYPLPSRAVDALSNEAARRASSPYKYTGAVSGTSPYSQIHSSPRSQQISSGTATPTIAVSSTAALSGRHNSPLRTNTTNGASSPSAVIHSWSVPTSTANVQHSSPPSQTITDSFNPQTILQMLESKIRGLETRNQQLEASVDSLSHKNQELTQDLTECEARLANQAALQSAVASLQHEVDRLREELLASAQREERRVEEVRRRAGAEIEDARRIAASREQEITSLRSAIRQLANIERSVD